MHSVIYRVIFCALDHRGSIGSQSASPSNSPLLPSMHCTGNFILEFPSINSRSRLFSRWRSRARSVEQTTSLAAAHASTQCMLGRRGEFEGLAFCQCWEMLALYLAYLYIDLCTGWQNHNINMRVWELIMFNVLMISQHMTDYIHQ